MDELIGGKWEQIHLWKGKKSTVLKTRAKCDTGHPISKIAWHYQERKLMQFWPLRVEIYPHLTLLSQLWETVSLLSTPKNIVIHPKHYLVYFQVWRIAKNSIQRFTSILNKAKMHDTVEVALHAMSADLTMDQKQSASQKSH